MKSSPTNTIFPLSYDRSRIRMRSNERNSSTSSNVGSPIKRFFLSSSSKKKSGLKKTSRSTKLTLSSNKSQKNIGEFFSGRSTTTPITSNNSKTTPRLRKCLFNNDSSIKSKTHSKNTSILDETSSSSFTYSSNFQRFVDVDILGQSSKLDLHANLEIVESVDAQPSTTKSENENESEKENSPKIHKSHSTAKLSDIEKEQHVHPKALTKLHTAIVREVDGCLESVRENFSRPDGFYRFVEGDADERKEKVEYDLDDEDTCWLNLVRNTKINGIKNLNEDNFEMCMDRLEKMAAHLQLNSLKTNSGQIKSKHSEQLDDDDIFCSICLDDECQNSNVILLCDSCNLAVHQECYGVPLVPEGQWLCSWCQWKGSNRGKSTPRKSRCKSSKNVKFITGGDNDDDSVAVSDGNDGTCCLCPVVGGALKKTDNGKWAHVLCALWIPEVGFGSVEYLEPITKLSEVPTARHKLTCSVCKKKDVGACIQCMRKNCYTAFHIMCAQKVGTYMRIEQGVEDDDADSPTNIKKSFLCDIHKPEGAKPFLPMYENEDDDDDDDDVSMEESVDASCRSKRQQSKIVPKSKSQCQLSTKKSANSQGSTKSKLNSKAGLNKSKSTSALVTSTVVLDLPTLSPNKLKEITKECLLTTTTPSSSYSSSSVSSSLSSLSSLHDVMEAVYNYWLLKRKSRNNIPLLKTYYTHLMSNHMPSKMGSTDDTKSAYDGLKDAKKLRNEMEKVRLLMELVRKREKLKLTMVKLKEQTINMKLNPWNAYLCKILDRLQTIDKCHVFAHPVAVDQVPGYKQKIKEPMDFSTMRSKVLTYKYETFEAFVRDFDLMVNNCLLFNSKHTVYHKSAVRMKKQSQHVLEEEKLRLQRFPRESLPVSLANEEMEIPNFVTAHDDSDDKNNNDGDAGDVVFKPSDNESKDNVVKICDDKIDDEEDDETEISDKSKVVDRSRRNIIYSNEPIDVDDDNENDDDDNEDDDQNITLQKTCEKIQTGICRLSDWVKKQSRGGTKVESTDKNGDDGSNDDAKAVTCTDKVGVADINQNPADAVVNDASHGNSGGHENDDSDDDSLRDSTICYANDKNGNADVTYNNDDDGGGGEMRMDENVNVRRTSASDSSNKDGGNIAKKNDGDGDDDDDDDDCGIIIERIDLVREKMDGDDDGVKVGMSSSDHFFSEEIIADDDETDDNNVKSANDDDSNKNDDGDDLKCDGDSNDIVVETISIEDEEEICVIDRSDEEGEDGGASDDRVDDEVNDKEMLRNNILSRLDFINPESTDGAKSKSCVVDTYDNNGDDIIDDKLSFKNKIIDNSCCIGNVPSSSNSSCNNSNTNILESSINRVNFKKQTIVNFLTSLLTTVKNSSEADLQNNLKLEVKNENLTIDGNKIENVIGLNLNILPALRTFNKLMMLCSRNAVDDEEDEEEEEEEVATTATKNRENFTPNAKRQHPSDFTAPCSTFSLSSIATQNRKKFKTSKSFDMEKSKSANNKAQLNNNNNNNAIYKAPRQASEVPNSYSKSVTSMVKDEKVRGLEVRRTSDRPKTATHRYLIDDNLFFQSLTSPIKRKRKTFQQLTDTTTTTSTISTMTSSAASKSTLTKNSNNSNSNNDTDGLNTNSDEPPVLSRCPSPLYVSYDDDDDDDDNNNTIHYCAVEQSKFSKKKNKMYCTNKKSSSTTRHRHRPMRKKLKYFANTSPPRLVKNVLEPVRQTSSSIGKMLRSKLMKSNKDKKACRRSNEAHRNKSFKCNEKLRRGKSKDDGIGDVKQQNFNNIDEEDDEDDGDSLSCKKKMAHTDDYLELTNNNIMPELVKNASQPSSSSSPIATSSPSRADPSSSDKEMPNLFTETCFIESNAKHGGDGAKVGTKCHQKSNPITKLNNAGSKKGEQTTNDNVAAYVDAADSPGATDGIAVGSKKMEENGGAMDFQSCSRDVDDYDDDDIMIDCEEVEISTEDGEEDEEKGGESEMATAICDDANGDTTADDGSVIKMIGPGIICDKTVGNKNNKRCFVEREDEDVDDEETDDDHHAKKKIKLDVASSSLSSLLSSSSFSSLLSSSSSSLFSLSTSLSPSASCHSVICIKAPSVCSLSSSSSFSLASSSSSTSSLLSQYVIKNMSNGYTPMPSNLPLPTTSLSSSLTITSSSSSSSSSSSLLSSLSSSFLSSSSSVVEWKPTSSSSSSIVVDFIDTTSLDTSSSTPSSSLSSSSLTSSSSTSSSSSTATTSLASSSSSTSSCQSLPLKLRSCMSSFTSSSSGTTTASCLSSASISSSLTTTTYSFSSSTTLPSSSLASLLKPLSPVSSSISSSLTSSCISSPTKTVCFLNAKCTSSHVKLTSLTPKLTSPPPPPPPTSGLWLTTVNQHFFSTSVTSSVAITPTFIQLNGTTTSATDANLLRTTASTAATTSATATRLPRSLSSPPVEFMLKSAHVIIEKLNHLKSPSLPSSPSLSSATSTAAADDAAPFAAADDNEDSSR